MKSFLRRSLRSHENGSALITVILFTFVLFLLSGSVLQWSLSERRLNSRSAYWLEARNAAEAVAEYGCYQVATAFNTKMNPTFTASGTNPVTFPSSLASTFFAGSHIDLSSIELKAGTVTKVPSSGLYYIDPLDSNNKYDPMVGRYCYRRDVTILSKVTIRPATGSPITSYIEEKVSVRGAPLLAYAIFYSANDLEFGESPQMDIYGPVHVNGNLFPGPVGTAALTFHGPVTASGNVYHAWRGTTATAQEGGTYTIGTTTPVNFSTDGTTTGTTVSMRTSAGVWNDSTMGADGTTIHGLANLQALVTPARSAAFSQYASQTWHGNLQTAAMGIQAYNPMGFSEVVAHIAATNTDVLASDNGDGSAARPTADDNLTAGTSGTYGTGYGHGYGPHSLIEPSMPAPPSSDPYLFAKQSIEQQKLANNAGLYVKVDVTAADAATITLYGDPRSAPTGTPAANIGPNGGLKLGTVPTSVIQYIKYTKDGSNNVTQGIYDQHQNKGYNLVQIDMTNLKSAVSHMTTASGAVAGTDIVKADGFTKWGSGSSNGGFDQYNPGTTGWNGGIYVEVNSASSNHTGVILANGQVSTGTLMPNPAVVADNAPNGVGGLTVATNAPVYILGNFNANGTIGSGATTNSALYPDDYTGSNILTSTQSPVAIAADAVTVLSPNYFGTAGLTVSGKPAIAAPNAYTTGAVLVNPTSSAKSSLTQTSAPNASASVEIAAALITGTIPTSPDSSGTQQYSGGVHNLPRFLENYGSGASQKTVAIRGAMVSMYSSRIASAGWSQSYYSAPIRQWGFDQTFANGKFPPIIPRVLSYRRVDFTYILNAAAYAVEVSNL